MGQELPVYFMKPISRQDLDDTLREGLRQTEAALDRSHCPYSGLSVAAGLLLQDGAVLTGVNYESASYGLTLCAERSAITRAQAENRIGEVTAVLLTGRRAAGPALTEPLTPCGACRQWIVELAERLGRDLPVYTFCEGAESGRQGTAHTLLPDAFT